MRFATIFYCTHFKPLFAPAEEEEKFSKQNLFLLKMSSANARTNTFNETFLNDSYQDASTVSIELDKGKKTNKNLKNKKSKIYKNLFRFKISKYWRAM